MHKIIVVIDYEMKRKKQYIINFGHLEGEEKSNAKSIQSKTSVRRHEETITILASSLYDP